MKTLYYPEFGRLEVTDRPWPVIAPDEVFIEVHACGICGSELESFANQSTKRTPPMIMGHEFCGRVVSVGDLVEHWKPGDLVVSNAIVSCGNCSTCKGGETNLCPARRVFSIHRDGAFAQFVNVPQSSLLKWPSGVPASEACMAEPLANGVHMVALTRHIRCSNVLIYGAGPIGLLAQQAFQSVRGSKCIVADINSSRLAVADRLGAVKTIDPMLEDLPALITALTGGEGVDIVVDAVGRSATTSQGLSVLRPGGAMVLIGLGENAKVLSNYELILAEKQVIGSYGATQQDMEVALELISGKKVDVSSWVEQYSLSNGVEAFTRALKGENIKSVINIK